MGIVMSVGHFLIQFGVLEMGIVMVAGNFVSNLEVFKWV